MPDPAWVHADPTGERERRARAARVKYAHSPKGREAKARRRAKMAAIILEARARPCADCGRDDLPPQAMDLDHVPERGPKLFCVGAGKLNRTEKQIRAELAKCDPVDPTCHRLRTLSREG